MSRAHVLMKNLSKAEVEARSRMLRRCIECQLSSLFCVHFTTGSNQQQPLHNLQQARDMTVLLSAMIKSSSVPLGQSFFFFFWLTCLNNWMATYSLNPLKTKQWWNFSRAGLKELWVHSIWNVNQSSFKKPALGHTAAYVLNGVERAAHFAWHTSYTAWLWMKLWTAAAKF